MALGWIRPVILMPPAVLAGLAVITAVGAATMPPVGAWVSAFRVISERITRSRCSPS